VPKGSHIVTMAVVALVVIIAYEKFGAGKIAGK